MATLPQNVSDMSIDEKYDLLDALMIDIWSQPDDLTEAQKDELDRREAAYRQNPSDTLTWEEVRAGRTSR